jgi:uncharacterized protein involved in exopolysaccharide biosynthesis/Mrp family chromosome partitioning ATPase
VTIPAAAAEDGNPALAGLVRILREHWPALTALVAGGMLTGFLYGASVARVYRATATIEVQDLNENFLNLKDIAPATVGPSVAIDLQTQLRILHSPTLVEKVARRLTPTASMEQVEAAARALQVRETRQSRIVDLSYDGTDPAYAAAFVNQLAKEYIDQSVESRMEISRATSTWLERQLQELRSKLANSELKLQSYAQNSGLLVTTDTQRPDEEKLRQVQADLSKAQENRMAKEARRDMAIGAPLDSLEPPLGSALRDHRAKLADLHRQRADLVAVYTPEFSGVKRLDAQIADLEATVRRDAGSVLQAIKNDYVDSVRREKLLEQSYNNQVLQVTSKAAKAIQYGILKNEVESSRALYNTMLQKAAEAKVASALRATTARIVDSAGVPRAPFRPNRLLSILSGGTAGLLFGLVWLAARDRHARRILGTEELAAVTTVPVLGTLPEGPPPESYRSVLTSILLSPLARRTPQVIVFTSARPGEGKSELVLKLAVCLSHMKRRVLMIDGSLNGGLQKLFGQTREYGLRDLVELSGEGRDLLAYVANPTRLVGVDLASIGPESECVLDLMFLQGIEQLLEEMRRVYDIVLIDTPALLEFPDARVFARMSDGVALVVQTGTSAHDVKTAAKRLQWDESVLLGTVLNRV